MSRIGKQPIPIPEKVKVTLTGDVVHVEGPKGKISKLFAPVVKVTVADKVVTVSPTDDDSRFAKAMYGTVRSVIAGMVKGASEGYVKDLEIQGVGFKANLKGSVLDLAAPNVFLRAQAAASVVAGTPPRNVRDEALYASAVTLVLLLDSLLKDWAIPSFHDYIIGTMFASLSEPAEGLVCVHRHASAVRVANAEIELSLCDACRRRKR
jgi:hypothetical protein